MTLEEALDAAISTAKGAAIRMGEERQVSMAAGYEHEAAVLARWKPFILAALKHGEWLKAEAERTDAMVVHSFLTGDAHMCREYRIAVSQE